MKKYLSICFILILSVNGFSQESRLGKESTSSDEFGCPETWELNDLDLVADTTGPMLHYASIPEVFKTRLELPEEFAEKPYSSNKIGSIDSEESFDNHDDDIWTEIVIYGYLPSISGSVKRGNVKVDGTVTRSELLDNLDIGGMAYAEHRRGNWSFIADICYLDVSADDTVAANQSLAVELDAEFQQLLAEGFVGYRVFDRDYENTRLGIDVLGGLRYNYLDVDLDSTASLLGLSRSKRRNQDKAWVDGVIGGRVQYGQKSGWAVGGWADIGQGSDSNSYQLSGSLSYKFDNNIRVVAGYRQYHMEYYKGSGTSRRHIDLDYIGPFLGFAYSF